jgi:hypothetical protein
LNLVSTGRIQFPLSEIRTFPLLSQRILTHESTIIERIPTKRTSSVITTLEPLEQTIPMETILASPTLLVRQLAILTNHGITNSTTCLSFECSKDVSPPSQKPVNETVVAESNDGLSISEPRVPMLLVDGYTFGG